MFDQIENIKAEIESFKVDSKETLEQFKREFVGSKNKIKDLFKGIKEVENERKKEFGQKVNELKNLAEGKFAQLNITNIYSRQKRNTNLTFEPGNAWELQLSVAVNVEDKRLHSLYYLPMITSITS